MLSERWLKLLYRIAVRRCNMRWLCTLLLAAALSAFVAARGPRVARAAYAPFPPGCTLQIPVSQTTSTDLKTFTNNGYICYIFLISATAQNLSLVQGTGTTCATSTVALIGGTAASAAAAANGGFVLSMGAAGTYLKTTTTAQHLCLLQSSTGNVSGVIGYIDQP